ncbi:class I SAM-dependent methyltransferase [Acetobacteraceae bacterium ESL0709]|nr:class I SAM-dependent methyltransferase [Acetobacteraceae bacterium ESL0697]MDF7678912.1 class I SAM-dependent methyltransferase [Acetobacteraceae bacterium ESL0709]
MNSNHVYTSDWFVSHQPIWERIISNLKPEKILEIGSYEGRSICFAIDHAAQYKNIEIHCVDTWKGGIEHERIGIDMQNVEKRFDHNTNLSIIRAKNKVDLIKHKEMSDVALPRILSDLGKDYFDMIYIDGSHQAKDVLFDAVLSFKLLKVSGVLIFDDYLWKENTIGGENILRCPKIAIDSFCNIFSHEIQILQAPLYQIYIVKVKD